MNGNERIKDTNLYEDIPEGEGRLEREMEVYRLLKRLKIPYQRLNHGPMATIEDCPGRKKV